MREDARLFHLNRKVAANSHPDPVDKPVVFFNASTRIGGVSQNAAFSLLSAWGLQLAGIPVVNFVCHSGMSHCVLGTNPDAPASNPPCKLCIAQSRKLYASAPTFWFNYSPNEELSQSLKDLCLDDLEHFTYQIQGQSLPPNPDKPEPKRVLSGKSLHNKQGIHWLGPDHDPIPIGQIILPSIRWVLRRHNLTDDHTTCYLYKEFIKSGVHIADRFREFLDRIDPQAVVVFNGLQYPEAVVCWVASHRGIRVITYEVSFQPFSGFFSEGQATAYPIEIPEEFKLSTEQNNRLDEYLSLRFKGEFTMAGIRFWPEIHGLEESFLDKAAQFKQIVPIFTNVIFDTSQVHANVIFPHMFAWLENVLATIRAHPETLFVIRAHPDEKRPGTRKQSRESVSDWIQKHKVDNLPNVVFIDSQEYTSSYSLIQRAKFVIVYNSSIGLEATLLGVVILCGGRARYMQYPTGFFPKSLEEFSQLAEKFIDADHLVVPSEFIENARRFLYYQLFRVSMPFDEYLTSHQTPGFVKFRRFSWQSLLPIRSSVLKIIKDGIVNGSPFVIQDDM